MFRFLIKRSAVLAFFWALALAASRAHAQATGLVAEYGFNEGSGTTVADSSGNANTGTITSATWVTTGKYGNALLFNGSTAKIRVNDANVLDLTGAMTIEAWVYPTASQSGWRTVVQKQADSYFLQAGNSGGALRPAGGGTFGTTNTYVGAPSAIAQNVWTHLATTYDGALIRLYVNGAQVASKARTGAIAPTGNPLWIGGNTPYGEYFKGRIDEVRIYNRALTVAEIASDMARAVGPLDTTVPGATTNLTATPASSSQINLAWTAATDNVGVTGYDVERCAGVSCTTFAQVGTATGTTYNDTGLAASTSYSYRVRAKDAAGNRGAYSNTASAATPAAPDTPPTAPTNLTASAPSTTQVNLAWVAATDDHGISLYEIERCQGAGCATFLQVATATGTTYNDAGLTASTSYSYRVRARDTINAPGPYSNVATAATPASPDTTPPTAPTNLAATAASSTQLNLAWTAATDDRAIALYEVERCQGAGCAVFTLVGTATGTTYNDAGLTASTSYSYRARAKDTSNNYGPYGNVATAATPAAPPPSTGLVAAYGFDEGAGSAVADATGNGNTGTIANATWTTAGKSGGALLFNGTSAKVTIPDANALDLTTAMTLEAWVYPTVTPTNWSTILHKETDRYYIAAGSGGGTPAAGGTFASGNANAYGAAPLTANAWTHVAATFDGTTLRLFLNGTQAASQAVTGPLSVSASPLSIGGTAAYGEYFTGRIDEVRVYNRALGATELQTDMTIAVAGSPAPNGPKLTITAPAEAATVYGGTVNVAYTWSGDLTEVNHVHFQLDGDPVKMDLTFDGVYQFQGVRVGAHTLNGWLVRADHSKIAGSDATPVHFTDALDPADPVAPLVAMTAPAGGSTVSGVTTATADATDNVGVYGVQFKLDGAKLGAEDLVAPYATDWDTATAANGSHTLTATARDVAGNETTAASVTVTVSNLGPNDPSVVGQWAGPYNWPLVSVHTTLMPNGKVLLYDDHTTSAGVQVWDPVTDTLTARPYNANNLFCSGHTILPDGRVLAVGGHIGTYIGIPDATFFDPTTETWSPAATMAYGRWYPTATALPNGKVLAVSGAIDCPTCNDPAGTHAGIALIPEVYDPRTNTWTKLTNASLSLPLYPHMHVLPDGRVFAVASQEDPIVSRVLDLNAQTWTVVDPVARDAGSSVMYRSGKILKTGTSRNPDYAPVPAVASAWAIDMNLPAPTWRAVAPMAFPRTQHNLTMLPDGNVLLVGGGTNSNVYDVASAVKAAELWSPQTETWKTLASMQEPRLYHSTALLLPDARVMVSGGGRFGPDFPSAEIYSPPYLFKGPRPALTSAPQTIQYNAHFAVGTPDGARIAKVTLLRLGSPTHAFDENQRYVELPFAPAGAGLDVTGPTDVNIVLPGHYMLFLVDTNGVPSVAAIVRFPAPWEDTVPPTAPSNLAASAAPGKVDLTWTAATDDNGVAVYNVHRATLPGFAPGPGNRIGQSATTSYRDTGFADGAYSYAVTAQDPGGNIGPASNEASVVAQADTTPPAVAVTSPLPGATLLGVVTVTADATDDIGVAGVQFLLDGAVLGAEDTTAPYAVDWNTGLALNGAHTLSARARDAKGNTQTAANVAVTVSNTTIQGLAAAYGFDEGTGTAVRDASANANDGTVSGTTWTTGHAGNALSYNGQNSYVQTPSSASLDIAGKAITIEMWANITAGSANDYVLVAKPWAATGQPYPYYQYGVEYDANGARTLDFYFGDTTAQLRGPFSMIPQTGVWTHLAFTYDGTTVKGYLDGVLKLSAPATTDIQARGTGLRLGVDGAYQQGFGGKLDDLRIYTRALTQAEIQQDMVTPVN